MAAQYFEHDITEDEYDRIMKVIFNAMDSGSKWTGMTYEDGMMAIMDLMEGNTTIEEIED
jgi:hypothetical protein